MKLKGGILFYSLVVIIIASSIVGLILMNSFYENHFLISSVKHNELQRNVFSAINLFIGGEDIFYEKDSLTIELFNDKPSKVTLERKRWGNYDIISASAKWKSDSFTKTALIGSDIFTEEPIALLMADEGRVLSLSGKTELKGTCYLPEKTARMASIEGQSYLYKKNVFGEIKESPKTFPEINKELFKFFTSIFNDGQFENDTIINLDDLDSDSLMNSFGRRTIIIKNETGSSFSNYTFKGNIIIWTDHTLVIEETTKLEDVILFAPRILIKSGFTGAIQAYAIESIVIESNCKLKFPTQLCVLQGEGKYNPSDSLIISIGSSTKLDGAAVINSNGLIAFMRIEKDVLISGQVYCPGIIELMGEISGSLLCRSFYLETSRAKYYNHLLNTKIDFTALSENFVGIELLRINPKKSIIKWLN